MIVFWPTNVHTRALPFYIKYVDIIVKKRYLVIACKLFKCMPWNEIIKFWKCGYLIFFFRVELIFKDSRKCIDTGYNQSSESSKKQLTILLVVFSWILHIWVIGHKNQYLTVSLDHLFPLTGISLFCFSKMIKHKHVVVKVI